MKNISRLRQNNSLNLLDHKYMVKSKFNNPQIKAGRKSQTVMFDPDLFILPTPASLDSKSKRKIKAMQKQWNLPEMGILTYWIRQLYYLGALPTEKLTRICSIPELNKFIDEEIKV